MIYRHLPVHVICPTRGRQFKAGRMVKSFTDTSSQAIMTLIPDEDEAEMYQHLAGERVRVKPQVGRGPLKSVNDAVFSTKAAVHGLVTDDSEFTTPGWDDYVMRCLDSFPEGVGVVSPYHNHGRHVDMAFATTPFVETLGWFIPVGLYFQLYHWCWPTVLAVLAEATDPRCLVHALQSDFYIRHIIEETSNLDRRDSDHAQFLTFMMSEHGFTQSLDALRKRTVRAR